MILTNRLCIEKKLFGLSSRTILEKHHWIIVCDKSVFLNWVDIGRMFTATIKTVSIILINNDVCMYVRRCLILNSFSICFTFKFDFFVLCKKSWCGLETQGRKTIWNMHTLKTWVKTVLKTRIYRFHLFKTYSNCLSW